MRTVPSFSLALGPYLEAFIRGARVALCASQAANLADELKRRGARRVSVYDPQQTNDARRDGPFDLVVVPNVESLPSPADAWTIFPPLLTERGLLLVAAPASDAAEEASVGYYELYDALAAKFAHVAMVGQVPFTGVAFVDFGHEGDPDVTVDTSLVSEETRRSAFFLAFASQHPFALDNYSIVETFVAASAPVVAPVVEPDVVALTELRVQLEAVRTELDVVRDARRTLEAQRHEAVQRLERVTEQLDAVRGENAQFKIFEQAAKQRASQLTQEVRERQTHLDRLRHQEAQEREQRVRLADELTRAQQQNDHVRQEIEKAHQELKALRDADAGDVSVMEAALRERAREILRLQQEVERRGVMVQELLDGIEAGSAEALLVG